MYSGITRSIISYEKNDKASCLTHAEAMEANLHGLFRELAHRMNDPTISRSVWSRHIGGVTSWATVEDSEGGEVEYGGLSASQILLFSVMNAFLGMAPYPSNEETQMHITRNMRQVSTTVGHHSLRGKLSKEQPEDEAISQVLERVVKQMRVSW